MTPTIRIYSDWSILEKNINLSKWTKTQWFSSHLFFTGLLLTLHSLSLFVCIAFVLSALVALGLVCGPDGVVRFPPDALPCIVLFCPSVSQLCLVALPRLYHVPFYLCTCLDALSCCLFSCLGFPSLYDLFSSPICSRVTACCRVVLFVVLFVVSCVVLLLCCVVCCVVCQVSCSRLVTSYLALSWFVGRADFFFYCLPCGCLSRLFGWDSLCFTSSCLARMHITITAVWKKNNEMMDGVALGREKGGKEGVRCLPPRCLHAMSCLSSYASSLSGLGFVKLTVREWKDFCFRCSTLLRHFIYRPSKYDLLSFTHSLFSLSWLICAIFTCLHLHRCKINCFEPVFHG